MDRYQRRGAAEREGGGDEHTHSKVSCQSRTLTFGHYQRGETRQSETSSPRVSNKDGRRPDSTLFRISLWDQRLSSWISDR